MAIPITCPSCSTQFNAPEKFAGKKVKCPKCPAPIRIPLIHTPIPTQELEKIEEGIVFPTQRGRTYDVAKKSNSPKGGQAFPFASKPASLAVVVIVSAVTILLFCLFCGGILNRMNSVQEPVFDPAANQALTKKNADAKAQAENKKEQEAQMAKLEAERKARELEAAKPKYGILQGASTVPVAVSKDVWDHWTTSNDINEGERYIDTGQVWYIKSGTKVTILSKGLFYCELLVLEGNDQDRNVWTGVQFLQETPGN